jgi:hypothetical protein
MSEIIVLKDLGTHFGDARNQGPRPTCLAFAASDAHAALRTGWTPLSCEFAFYQAQRRAGRPPDRGALLSSMLEALRQDGQPAEAGWPYLAVTPTDAASWVPPEGASPLYGRAGEKRTPSIDKIIAELNGDRPTILLLMLSRAFYAPSAQAVVRRPLAKVRTRYGGTRWWRWRTVPLMANVPSSSATAGARAGVLQAMAGSPTPF